MSNGFGFPFGVSGSLHSPGFVPDPGDVSHSPGYVPNEHGLWVPLGMASVQDGSTNVAPANVLKFTQGVTVSDAGGGEAHASVNSMSAAGGSHRPGLVPDPGGTAHFPPYVLGDDGSWVPLSTASGWATHFIGSSVTLSAAAWTSIISATPAAGGYFVFATATIENLSGTDQQVAIRFRVGGITTVAAEALVPNSYSIAISLPVWPSDTTGASLFDLQAFTPASGFDARATTQQQNIAGPTGFTLMAY